MVVLVFFCFVDILEGFALAGTEKQSSSTSIDFKLVKNLCGDDACVFLYREKAFALFEPWIYIAYVPDSAPV